MSLTVPSTAQIAANLETQVASQLAVTVPWLPKSWTPVMAKALAGTFVILYKYSSWSTLQLFVRHASSRETVIGGVRLIPLVEWGRLLGAGDPNPALRAEHTIDVTVLQQGGTLGARRRLIHTTSGVIFATISAVELDAATVQVKIRAVSDEDGGDGSGVQGNLAVSETVSFVNPPSAINRDATIVSTEVKGVDSEDMEDYRRRVIRHAQTPPQGGAYSDYRLWSEEVEDVFAAYPYTGDPGEVNVYVEATTTHDADGIPNATLLTAVSDSIDLDSQGLATRRPANALVNVLPITRTAFDVTINDLDPGEGVLADVKTNIESALDEYFRSLQPYIDGLDPLPKRNSFTPGTVTAVVSGVVETTGGTFSSAEIAGVLVQRILADGETAKLGTTTYSP